MQIGEVAKRTSLTVDAIRFYEKRKLLPKAVRTAGRFPSSVQWGNAVPVYFGGAVVDVAPEVRQQLAALSEGMLEH